MQLVYTFGSLYENFCNNIGKLWGVVENKNTIFPIYALIVGEKANFIQLFQRLKGNKAVINFEIRVAIDGIVCYNTAYMMI